MGKQKDPLEKITELINSTVAAAFEKREQTEREAKDPAAKIEGMIKRAVNEAVASHFEAFKQGLLEEDEPEDKDKGGDGGDILTGLFGGGRK